MKLGNKIADILKKLNIPECDGCKRRKKWLNTQLNTEMGRKTKNGNK